MEAVGFLLENRAPKSVLTDSLLIDDAMLIWTGDADRWHLEALVYLLGHLAPERVLTYGLLIDVVMHIRAGDDERCT